MKTIDYNCISKMTLLSVNEQVGDCQKDRWEKERVIIQHLTKKEISLTSKFLKMYILGVSLFSLCVRGDEVEPSYLPQC